MRPLYLDNATFTSGQDIRQSHSFNGSNHQCYYSRAVNCIYQNGCIAYDYYVNEFFVCYNHRHSVARDDFNSYHSEKTLLSQSP